MRTVLLSSLFAAAVVGADTTSLIGDGGLAAWKQPTHDWLIVGAAALDGADQKKLTLSDGAGVLANGRKGHTGNLVSAAEFGDAQIHVEWLVPKGSNSGVYVMGRYEVQVLDSFGTATPGSGDAGGIYQRWDPKRGQGKEGFEGHPPRVNAAKAPGEWQVFDITFTAPRFDAAGVKTANAVFVKVVHNGQVVHENVEVTGPTRSSLWEYDAEKPTGPLMLQGDHGPVVYRNITVTPLGK
jgi:hypothetical protein